MRRSLGGAGLLLLAVFVLPLFAADDVNEPKKEPKKDNGMVYLRTVKGTVLTIDEAKKTGNRSPFFLKTGAAAGGSSC